MRNGSISKTKKADASRGTGRTRPGRKPDPLGREKLLASAAQIFMERGYVGTSIDDIADRLGATKGFFYHHFSSKAELYFGVIDSAMTRIDAAVRPVFELDMAPRIKLEMMAEKHALALMENFAASKVGVQGLEKSLFKNAAAGERRSLQRIIKERDRYEDMFSGTIRAGIKAGVFSEQPVGIATRAVLGALNWMTLWYDPTRATPDAKKKSMAASLAAFVMQGLRR